MAKHNPANERIKREYFAYLKGPRGRDVATIDGVAKSLARFETSTGARDFKKFRREQATSFGERLTGFFSKAQLFGFTGTPIFADNASRNELGKRTTKDLFGEHTDHVLPFVRSSHPPTRRSPNHPI